MNANELADVLMFTKFQVDEDGTMIGVSHQAVNEAATMLRQQQLKIDNLLENNARLDSEIEVLKSHPVKELTDEEIYRLLADSIWAVGLNTDCLDEQNWADGITVAKAILKKAQEK